MSYEQCKRQLKRLCLGVNRPLRIVAAFLRVRNTRTDLRITTIHLPSELLTKRRPTNEFVSTRKIRH